jgi:hypothetical protein
MRSSVTLVASFLLTVFSLLYATAIQTNRHHNPNLIQSGAWSRETISLFNTWGPVGENPHRNVILYSPDHHKAIRVQGNKVTAVFQGKEFPTDFGHKTNAELGWAPDSSRFFLTWTTGGELGVWKTDVYQVSDAGLKEVNGIGKNAIGDFDLRIRQLPPPRQFEKEPGLSYWSGLHYCEPNLVGSQWLNGSKELLVSVLVPNTSYCRYMSEFSVYRIAVPSGQILQRYTAQEAHRIFRRENLPIIVR